MKFNTVSEAFNYYRTQSVEDMQKRAAAIGKEIESNADADVEALNIELKGIKEARDNAETRSEAKRTLSFFEGGDMKPASFNAENVLESEEYRSAFFKTLLGQKLSEVEKRAFDMATEPEATSTILRAIARRYFLLIP